MLGLILSYNGKICRPADGNAGTNKKGAPMDWLLFIGIFAAWFILNRWILPKMGVQT